MAAKYNYYVKLKQKQQENLAPIRTERQRY